MKRHWRKIGIGPKRTQYGHTFSITSNAYSDPRAVLLADDDFATGSLNVVSYARPGKLFTASQRQMTTQIGTFKPKPFQWVLNAVMALLAADTE